MSNIRVTRFVRDDTGTGSCGEALNFGILNKQETNPDVEDVAVMTQHSVDREYLPFIAENLLAYTVIFQQLLPRFGRVDLVSPKMSLMLYRITKVFDQPNLPNYLREVEHCVENNRSPSHKYSDQWASSLPPLSPTCNWSTNTSVNIESPVKSPREQAFSPVLNFDKSRHLAM
ncbi:hypothetical protein NQ317_007595 [Molorchus minor]|uniref:Uncharacterized protein n=1 Tax=Molorchus minor TaxID=1323400 RepID=A0ABQ9IVS2_9CUCU|nr:hypothetical protein NQ317_007595 [Molorchus minor]